MPFGALFPGGGFRYAALVTSIVRPWLQRLPLLTDRPAMACALALLLSLFAWWIRWALDPIFPPGFPYLTFFPAVIVSSFMFGPLAGTLAAAAGGLAAWYFFIPPFQSFALQPGTGVALGFYVGVVGVDIALVHWMQRANRGLKLEQERSRALAERTELLFHELQHRVSNNLQMAGAVLNLQKRGVVDPVARKAIDDAATKLQLIGRIQRQLYGTRGEPVNVDVFVQQLVDDLSAAAGRPGIRYTVDAEQGVSLEPTTLIPLALIMAEGIANAVEHGFAGRDTGQIDVRLHRHGPNLRLTVSDDGAGLPAGFDVETATSLGLRIARTLTRQLGGRFEVTPGTRGAITSLSFPIHSHSSPGGG